MAYLLILAIAMLGYRANRVKEMKQLRAQLSRSAAERNTKHSVDAELVRLTQLIPTEANVPSFIETLYRYAKESGLKQHEVVTEATAKTASARPGAIETGTVEKHRLRVSANGSFRDFAEYIRRLQNIEHFNRITEFKLTPDNGQLKGTVTLELYSLPVKHAN